MYNAPYSSMIPEDFRRELDKPSRQEWHEHEIISEWFKAHPHLVLEMVSDDNQNKYRVQLYQMGEEPMRGCTLYLNGSVALPIAKAWANENYVTNADISMCVGNTDFGEGVVIRKMIAHTLFQYSCGFGTGYSSTKLCEDLELLDGGYLTKKGKRYMHYELGNVIAKMVSV